jgi:hypothetical protein
MMMTATGKSTVRRRLLLIANRSFDIILFIFMFQKEAFRKMALLLVLLLQLRFSGW